MIPQKAIANVLIEYFVFPASNCETYILFDVIYLTYLSFSMVDSLCFNSQLIFFLNLKLEFLTQFPSSNDETYNHLFAVFLFPGIVCQQIPSVVQIFSCSIFLQY